MKTMSETLGETCHISPLAKKLRRLGLACLAEWKQLAVLRGCEYYQQGPVEITDPGREFISNRELLVALLLGENPFDLMAFRMAGQLLAQESNLDALVQLAKQERVSKRVRYIVEKGLEVEPDNEKWSTLRDRLSGHHYPLGSLPHADRFTVDVGGGRGLLGKPRQRKWLTLNDH